MSAGSSRGALVTFDLFSALIDSRTGGSAFFEELSRSHAWDRSGAELYDEWDRRNKKSQKDTHDWVPFVEHCRRAWHGTCAHFGLVPSAYASPVASIDHDVERLVASMSGWPLWPDVADGLSAFDGVDIGVLSNVDDAILRRTRVAPVIRPDAAFTSERLRAYKPAAEIYHRAQAHSQDRAFVHVASSARDVRGALEAVIPCIRLSRPGHAVDREGPRPRFEAASVAEVATLLPQVLAHDENFTNRDRARG